MRILLALLVVTFLADSRGCGQVRASDHEWIESLKKTPVAKLEPGLPEKSFDLWFTSLAHSAQPRYETVACEAAGAGSAGNCILVKAEVPPMRAVKLTFAVSTESASHPGETAFTFAGGTIGPADPRSKQPTRLVRKLGELEAMLK